MSMKRKITREVIEGDIESVKRCYTELNKIGSYLERYKYLQMSGSVGIQTFGFERYLNQTFYKSDEWKKVRRQVIIRDCGCDMGDPEHPEVGVRGDPEVGDPKSGELGEPIDSDGQSDSDEREETNETPLSHKVHNQTYENIHEVQTLNSSNDSGRYMLPFRYNRGQPPNRYSLDQESKKEKYSIANYMSTQRLSKPLKAFSYKLSTEYIPSTVEEALTDP